MKSLFKNANLLIEIAFFEVEFLLAYAAVFLVAGNCFLEEAVLLLDFVEENIGFGVETIDIFVR